MLMFIIAVVIAYIYDYRRHNENYGGRVETILYLVAIGFLVLAALREFLK